MVLGWGVTWVWDVQRGGRTYFLVGSPAQQPTAFWSQRQGLEDSCPSSPSSCPPACSRLKHLLESLGQQEFCWPGSEGLEKERVTI